MREREEEKESRMHPRKTPKKKNFPVSRTRGGNCASSRLFLSREERLFFTNCELCDTEEGERERERENMERERERESGRVEERERELTWLLVLMMLKGVKVGSNKSKSGLISSGD